MSLILILNLNILAIYYYIINALQISELRDFKKCTKIKCYF